MADATPTNTSAQQAYTAARYMLMMAGAWLAAHNYIPQAEVNEAVSALMILGPVAWGFLNNILIARKAEEREHAAVNAGIAAVTPMTQQPITVTKDQAKVIIQGATVENIANGG